MDSDIRLLLSKTEDFGMTEKQKKMLGRIIASICPVCCPADRRAHRNVGERECVDSVCDLSGTVSDHRV